nr:MAG TPA: hypothetical protein [Caudoviricetes sp.]
MLYANRQKIKALYIALYRRLCYNCPVNVFTLGFRVFFCP